MRVYIASDQHLEFRRPGREEDYLSKVPPLDAKVAIVAGDFDVMFREQALDNLRRFCASFDEVFYVPGNHDYYGSFVQPIDERLANLKGHIPSLRLLQTGKVFELDGRRILGDTMWVRDSRVLKESRGMINDSRQIYDFWDHMPKKNADFLAFLDKELKQGDIVVTHHLPSDKSTPPMWRGAATQPWFVCDVEALILERKPAVWIHGHTHTRCEYMLGETRVICNPAGYPSESGPLPGPLAPYIFEI
jgi:predicted phosphodiesterase